MKGSFFKSSIPSCTQDIQDANIPLLIFHDFAIPTYMSIWVWYGREEVNYRVDHLVVLARMVRIWKQALFLIQPAPICGAIVSSSACSGSTHQKHMRESGSSRPRRSAYPGDGSKQSASCDRQTRFTAFSVSSGSIPTTYRFFSRTDLPRSQHSAPHKDWQIRVSGVPASLPAPRPLPDRWPGLLSAGAGRPGQEQCPPHRYQ
jgi:hypothetical protein